MLKIRVLKEEREDLMEKAVNLSQNVRTLKSELAQRDDKNEALKHEIIKLKQDGAYRFDMY